MTPTLIHESCGIEVYHGDSILFPYDDRFDNVVCDPPFLPRVHQKASTQRNNKIQKNDFGFSHITPLLRMSIATRVKLASSWSLVCSDVEGVREWQRDIEAVGAEYTVPLPWRRWSSPPRGKKPPYTHEEVILCHSGGQKRGYSGPGNFDGFDEKCMRGSEKHPTQKPLSRELLMIELFTEVGDYVLDPTGGAGTTALACKLLGRRCCIIDNDKKWAERIAERVTSDLSKRDQDGLAAFAEKMVTIRSEIERTRAHTAKVRARKAAKL